MIGITALVLLERRRPSAALAWLLALIFLPLFGLCLYFLLGAPACGDAGDCERGAASTRPTSRGLLPLETPLEALEQPLRGLVALALSSSAAPLRRAGAVDLLADPAQAFAADGGRDRRRGAGRSTSPCTSGATMTPGGAGSTSCASARAPASRCGSSTTSSAASAPRASCSSAWSRPAVGCLRFGAVRLRYRPLMINFRNHRKIVIVDGDLGFTGGLNVGDEYLGRGLGARPWSDLPGADHRRRGARPAGHLPRGLAGRALRAITPKIRRSRVSSPTCWRARRGTRAGRCCRIVPSGPDLPFIDAIRGPVHRRDRLGAGALLDRHALLRARRAAVAGAQDRARCAAATCGCSLRLCARQRLRAFVGLAGASYYDELLAAGCRIYEYLPGMLHAKYLLVDDRVAAIGSANMDVRSFYLNYEVTALFYDRRLTLDLAEVFTRELAQALEVRPEARAASCRCRRRLGEGFARLLSPLL